MAITTLACAKLLNLFLRPRSYIILRTGELLTKVIHYKRWSLDTKEGHKQEQITYKYKPIDTRLVHKYLILLFLNLGMSQFIFRYTIMYSFMLMMQTTPAAMFCVFLFLNNQSSNMNSI